MSLVKGIISISILIASFTSLYAASESRTQSLAIGHDPFQYASEYTDSESHLQYLKARYYNPDLNVFIERDSYRLMNRYSYAGGNPVMNVDPSGHILKPTGEFFGLMGGIISLPVAFQTMQNGFYYCMDAPIARSAFARVIAKNPRIFMMTLGGDFLSVISYLLQQQFIKTDNDKYAIASWVTGGAGFLLSAGSAGRAVRAMPAERQALTREIQAAQRAGQAERGVQRQIVNELNRVQEQERLGAERFAAAQRAPASQQALANNNSFWDQPPIDVLNNNNNNVPASETELAPMGAEL